MLLKAIGLVLVLVGIVVGAPVVLPLLMVALVMAWYLLKLAAMVAVVYIGYRLLGQRSFSMT